MAYKEIFLVQVFENNSKNRLVPGQVYRVKDGEDAKRKAEALSARVAGCVALSQIVDEQAETSEEPVVLAFYGVVPAELRSEDAA